MFSRVSATMNAPPPVASTCGPGGEQARDHAALAVAEIGLAVILEDVGDGLAGRPLDLLVGVDEGHAEAGRQAAADRRLAAAGHADQDDRPAAQRRAQALRPGSSSASSFLPPCPNRIITSLVGSMPCPWAGRPRRQFCLWLAAFWRNIECVRGLAWPAQLGFADPRRPGHNRVTLALNILGRERVRHMPSLIRFLVVVGVLGAHGVWRPVRDGGVLRARAERNVDHRARRQDTPLDGRSADDPSDARSPIKPPTRPWQSCWA